MATDNDECAICGSLSYFYFDQDGEEHNCPQADCPKKPMSLAEKVGSAAAVIARNAGSVGVCLARGCRNVDTSPDGLCDAHAGLVRLRTALNEVVRCKREIDETFARWQYNPTHPTIDTKAPYTAAVRAFDTAIERADRVLGAAAVGVLSEGPEQ